MTTVGERMVTVGDLSAEPSMEEILSSIKRIIAEEGEAPARGRRMGRAGVPSAAALATAVDEVLELSDPMPATPAAAELARRAEARAELAGGSATADGPPPPEPAPTPVARPTPRPASADTAAPDPIASRETVDASRGSLDALARMMVRPEHGSDGTLEGLVREMLRPMLRDWLDRNLPALVEDMVAREIARISGARD